MRRRPDSFSSPVIKISRNCVLFSCNSAGSWCKTRMAEAIRLAAVVVLPLLCNYPARQFNPESAVSRRPSPPDKYIKRFNKTLRSLLRRVFLASPGLILAGLLDETVKSVYAGHTV